MPTAVMHCCSEISLSV